MFEHVTCIFRSPEVGFVWDLSFFDSMPMSKSNNFGVHTCSPEDINVDQANGMRDDEATALKEHITTVWK